MSDQLWTDLALVGVILVVLTYGIAVGATLTYRRQRGQPPISLPSAKAVLRRFNPFRKRAKSEPVDTAKRWSA